MKNDKLNENELKILCEALKESKEKVISLEQELLYAKENINDYGHYYTYKLGKTIVNSRSLLGVLTLPFRVYKLNKELKKYRYQPILKKINLDSKVAKKHIELKPSKGGKYGKMIVILDEISYVSWGNEFQIFPLNINNYNKQIETTTSQALLLESCWNGNAGKWQYAFTSPELKHSNAQNLLKAISVAKKQKLPVVFWNKEDPMHYEKFLPIAKQCDVIFTTDINKVNDYKRDIPKAKIGVLPFAANIHLCNPKDRFRNTDQGSVCFAGSYYAEGHEDRKIQMDRLLPTIIDFKGVIYDRMSQQESERYSYPDKYADFIKPSVPFSEVIDVYKKYKIFLNVNTITDSPTMMSRRVYELLACGTPVISTPSKAIEEQFSGIVQIANNAKEANVIAERLLTDNWYWEKISHLGYREVMMKHTYDDRAFLISESLGNVVQKNEPLVSIIMATNRPHFIDRIVDNIAHQNHQNLEVILVVQGYTSEEVAYLKESLLNKAVFLKRIEVLVDNSENTLGGRLNIAGELAQGDYIAKMDDDDLYMSNYFVDMLLPFKFSDCGIVGKKEVFVFLEAEDKIMTRFKHERHKYVDFIAGPTIMMSKETFKKVKFGDKNRGEDSSFLQSAKEQNIKIYSSDPFNFIQWRSSNKAAHTWQVEDSFFTEKGEVVAESLDFSKIAF